MKFAVMKFAQGEDPLYSLFVFGINHKFCYLITNFWDSFYCKIPKSVQNFSKFSLFFANFHKFVFTKYFECYKTYFECSKIKNSSEGLRNFIRLKLKVYYTCAFYTVVNRPIYACLFIQILS